MVPNPAKGECKIELSLNGKNGTLIICDSKGAEVKRLNVFSHQPFVVIDISGYSKGIYFVTLITDGKIADSSKMVVGD